MIRGPFAGTLIFTAVLAAGLADMGCGRTTGYPGEELLDRAEFLIREQRYEEAKKLLKTFLYSHPDHSGAHYYLGRCYSESPEAFWFVIAQGEIETALDIFLRDGRRSTIKRFSDDYFEMICHLDIAKIYLRQIEFLIRQGAPPSIIKMTFEKTEQALEEARRVLPDSPDIALIENLLNMVRSHVRQPAQLDSGSRPRRYFTEDLQARIFGATRRNLPYFGSLTLAQPL